VGLGPREEFAHGLVEAEIETLTADAGLALEYRGALHAGQLASDRAADVLPESHLVPPALVREVEPPGTTPQIDPVPASGHQTPLSSIRASTVSQVVLTGRSRSTRRPRRRDNRAA